MPLESRNPALSPQIELALELEFEIVLLIESFRMRGWRSRWISLWRRDVGDEVCDW